MVLKQTAFKVENILHTGTDQINSFRVIYNNIAIVVLGYTLSNELKYLYLISVTLKLTKFKKRLSDSANMFPFFPEVSEANHDERDLCGTYPAWTRP